MRPNPVLNPVLIDGELVQQTLALFLKVGPHGAYLVITDCRNGPFGIVFSLIDSTVYISFVLKVWYFRYVRV